jgi:hypothetical protein
MAPTHSFVRHDVRICAKLVAEEPRKAILGLNRRKSTADLVARRRG